MTLQERIARKQHPDYHQGFADALDLTPLHYGMSPEYRSGWMGAYRCKRALKKILEAPPHSSEMVGDEV